MNEETLFELALNTPENERLALLDRECAGNPALRARVEALLRADAGGTAAWLAPPRNCGEAGADQAPLASPGALIAGRYKLLERIGEGGMGDVWVAEQTEPVRRKVALKLIKAGMDSKSVLARFEAERQALAVMDHPNIAKVLDGGLTDTGRPFFVMEYVKGVPITEYCDATRLSVPERLNLFVQVCHAVQHAHQKGIIHRDLKPSNILVAPYDDKPVPKVIDFGLAKAMHQSLTEQTLHTAHETVLGTPLYMSPEQAQLNNLDVDTRSDIYSLGVLLYELLTGTTPLEKQRFKEAAWDEIKRMIREEEPPRPSTRLSSSHTLPSLAAGRHTEPARLTKLVRGELDWIVMKSLEKDRSRRYETANGFAADVQRYLSGEPVLAAPPSARYRLGKFARKHRAALTTAAAIALLLVTGVAVSAWQAVRAMQAEEQAWEEQAKAVAERDEKEKARAAEAEQRKIAVANEKKARDAAEAAKKAEASAEEREAETKAVLKFVQEKIFAAARPKDQEGGLGHDVALADAVRAALPLMDKSFAKQPLIEARLRNTIGLSFRYLGDIKTAAKQHERARAIYLQHRGPEHPGTLSAMVNLANCFSEDGRVKEALDLQEKTLRIHEAKFGPKHLHTLADMVNLGGTYVRSGRVLDAIRLLEKALSLMKAEVPDHEFTFNCMDNLANAYVDAGRTKEALELRKETLQRRADTLGPYHPNTFISMTNLANSYAAAGRHKEALKLREETLKLQKAKIGPYHPSTLMSMHNLANSYFTDRRIPEALKLLEETFELRKGKIGLDHPETLSTMSNLANSYFVIGRVQDALQLHEDTLELRKKKLGPTHKATLASMHMLAFMYNRAGRIPDAIKLYQETIRLRKAKLGNDHPDTLLSMYSLANSYGESGRIPEAVKLHEETLERRKATLGHVHPDTLLSMFSLAAAYDRARSVQQALELAEETVRLMKANLSPDHMNTLQAMNNLADSYTNAGRPGDALALLKETLAGFLGRAADGPGKSGDQGQLLAWTHGLIGNAEKARHEYAAAVDAYTTSLEIYEKLDRAGALKNPYYRNVMNGFKKHAALCRKAQQAVQDLDFVFKQPAADVQILLSMRLRYLLKEQELPAALETVAKAKEIAGDNGDSTYDVACWYALCAEAAKKATTPVKGVPAPEKLAEEAMTLLKQSFANGFSNVALIKRDRDLNVLRDREDFKMLVAELEKKAKKK